MSPGCVFFRGFLSRVEKTGSRELFTLAVVALALGVAFGSAKLFGVSFALGAFFAGVVVNESDLSHRAAKELQPLQDAFTVLFFVAVGMLFDPSILIRQPLRGSGRACNCRNWKNASRFRDCSSAGRLRCGQHSLSRLHSLRLVNFHLSLSGLGVKLASGTRGRIESDCRGRAAFDHVQPGGVQCGARLRWPGRQA